MTAFADRFRCEDCGAKMPVPPIPCVCTSRRWTVPGTNLRIEQYQTAAEIGNRDS